MYATCPSFHFIAAISGSDGGATIEAEILPPPGR